MGCWRWVVAYPYRVYEKYAWPTEQKAQTWLSFMGWRHPSYATHNPLGAPKGPPAPPGSSRLPDYSSASVPHPGNELGFVPRWAVSKIDQHPSKSIKIFQEQDPLTSVKIHQDPFDSDYVDRGGQSSITLWKTCLWKVLPVSPEDESYSPILPVGDLSIGYRLLVPAMLGSWPWPSLSMAGMWSH